MSWTDIKAAAERLNQAADEQGDLDAAWASFVGTVSATRNAPPYHLRILLDAVDEAARDKSADALKILDHGCGGGVALLYLCALGYTGVYGIDLPANATDRLNRILREAVKIREPRFFTYEGGVLPFDDTMFDVIFSQQVLEHVRPNALDRYYSEEHRVLKPGGVAVHQVPHRLVPYDSHTRTWFLHYFPYGIWRWLLRRLGKASVTSETALFLRWPWIHRQKIRAVFARNEDLTAARLTGLTDFSGYDGPVTLRRFVARIARMPIIGGMVHATLTNFIMLDTVSHK